MISVNDPVTLNRLIAVALAVLGLIGAAFVYRPALFFFAGGSYDNCVLIHVRNAKTQGAVAAIQRSCLAKFPVTFDWDQISAQSGRKVWSKVKRSDIYKTLSANEKQELKEQYWDDVLLPYVRNDLASVAHARFIAER